MKPQTFELYWSFRSPFCYLAMDRLFALPDEMDVTIKMRHVWPAAIRKKGYFKSLHPNYRPYHGLDSPRVADYLGVPYAQPIPDPVVFDPVSSEPVADQPYIPRLTRLTLAARELGHEHGFLCSVMRLIWGGEIRGWDKADHLAGIAQALGMDFDQLSAIAEDNAERFDREVDDNGDRLTDAGHWGVPCMVLDGEPFFGQDRVDLLIWRLHQKDVG